MRFKKLIILIVIGLVLSLPSIAMADGGGPILLIFNIPIFLFGMVFILYEEWQVYRRMFKQISPCRAFADVAIVNITSTIVIGFGFPLLLAIVSGIGSELGGEIGDYIFALGTWVAGDNSPHANIAMIATVGWFIVTFFLTVYFEFLVLRKIWKKRESVSPDSLKKWSWAANLLSYATLILIFGLVLLFTTT
ncbi:MAG: hypothetical protein KAS69_05610 [Planctomycetes bacterium]|nr:hypothetical protein [Planctomycetota bacterium]